MYHLGYTENEINHRPARERLSKASAPFSQVSLQLFVSLQPNILSDENGFIRDSLTSLWCENIHFVVIYITRWRVIIYTLVCLFQNTIG